MSERTARPPKPKILKYGLEFDPAYSPLDIEFAMIRAGGFIKDSGQSHGNGLFFHTKEACTLLWPEDDSHRWSDLLLKTLCEERITVVQGPKDTGKTHGMSKFALVDYWAFPEITLTLISSTGIRELELRVWGDIKDCFERARKLYPNLPGNINHANHAIFTDVLADRGDVRDMRKGIICVPCIGGEGEWIGLDRFVGIKQKRRRLFGDEMQFMHPVYVNVLDAIDKGDFKGGFAGNPIGGNGKALDKIAEPVGGWSSLGEITKTTAWRNKYDGVTINFVGTDSPNFDADRTKTYSYLVNQEDVEKIAKRNGNDSPQYWTLALGVRKIGTDAYKVLTVEMCERCGAFNTPIWAGTSLTKILALDAGFGGDPCEVMVAEFGEDAAGNEIICFSPTVSIPIRVSADSSAEEQISLWVRAETTRLQIPPENVFFDAGMRATLAIHMARVISPQVNAVNFGGPATDRPVDKDTFIDDPVTKSKRLMKCNEQYSKFVTELWYSVRAIVDAKQARGLPKPVAEEFQLRDWRWVPGPLGQRYELETKPEFKSRNGFSPNKADVCSIAVEGARRLGFKIHRQPEPGTELKEEDDWLDQELQAHRKFHSEKELRYTNA